ncbi:hypothetical protein Patl1_09575 [Pistacia atlantica]|uniref:Uncharacterized protein n=1 Tax=Pistacia atlantica TaxID=434234 RepID=A0ACC1A4W6_9ROSI|nr:hypothetical protein Patl1_09575 [Pistacia atlantica]
MAKSIEVTELPARSAKFVARKQWVVAGADDIDLSCNQLHGSIPSNWGDLSHLTTLDLSSNQLTGTIPPSLGNLKNLTQLSLYFNKLSAAIPHEFGELSQLQLLYVIFPRSLCFKS